MGPGSILQERRHSQLEDITAENGAWPLFLREKSEWRMALKIRRGAKLFAKTFSNHEIGNAYNPFDYLTFFHIVIKVLLLFLKAL